MKHKERILVTGGAGFIGSALVLKLVEYGYYPVVIDNLSTGSLDKISVLDKSSFEFVEGDILDADLVNDLVISSHKVVHLAALSSVAQSMLSPLHTNEVNITGILNVINAISKTARKRMVFASSAAVYGDQTADVLSEDLLPNPKSVYAVSKLCCEMYCNAFSQNGLIDAVNLRFFNVYGEGQDPSSDYSAVIPHLSKQYLYTRTPKFMGTDYRAEILFMFLM